MFASDLPCEMNDNKHLLIQIRDFLYNQVNIGLSEVILPSEESPISRNNFRDTMTLESIRSEIGDCTRCKLHKSRTTIVFGEGKPNADLMFVGEGPGADEDLQGRPFVGRAGILLTKMISAMGLRRDDVYIANIVKCRPPQNRDPESEEVNTCIPFLHKQIRVVNPRVIITLGKTASQSLLKSRTPISQMRGKFHDWEGIPVMPTYHPAYLLRQEPDKQPKREAWADLQQVMSCLELPLPNIGEKQ